MQKCQLIFYCIVCPIFLFAQQVPLYIYEGDTLFSIAKQTSFLDDKTRQLDVHQVLRSTQFTPSVQEVFHLGGSNSRNAWIKFQIQNESSNDLLLELSTGIADTSYLYTIDNQNNISLQRIGKIFPFKERLVKHNLQVFTLQGKKSELTTYLLNIRSPYPLSIRAQVGTKNAFVETWHNSDLFHGIFIGVISVVLLFNLLFFLTSRESFYGFYIGYAVFIMLTILRFDGYLYQYVHPNNPQIHIVGFYFHGFAGIFGIYFSRSFLNIKQYAPQLDKGMVAFIFFYAANICLAVLGLYELNILSIYAMTFPFNLFLIFTGVQVYRKGNQIARFFIAAALCLTSGITLFTLYNMGIIESNMWTRNIMYIAVAIESVLFFMAIVDRFSILRKEKHDVQERMIESLRQNEKLMAERNQILEEHARNRALEVEVMQSQISEYAQKLIKSNQELTDFAHIASHDLRAPIRNIGSFAQLLEKRLQNSLDSRAQEYLEFIKTNVRQSTKLIEDLLNYSKIDKNIGEPQPVDLNNVLFLVNNNLQSIIVEKNAQIIAKELPTLRGHSSLFTQLFQNIINNGLKYNKSAVPTVTISAIWQDNDWVFRIQDNGIGIPPQYQEQIFGMFRRLHSSAEYEGSGIGLAFCQRIVSTYGGRIWLESSEGHGTTFFFTVPKAVTKTAHKSEELATDARPKQTDTPFLKENVIAQQPLLPVFTLPAPAPISRNGEYRSSNRVTNEPISHQPETAPLPISFNIESFLKKTFERHK
ncbi:MAG: hypothetical protein JNL70_03720 [Saprospiraceae bacterium]|nr:hypothetical protein [Saprospiraceae bacterium]